MNKACPYTMSTHRDAQFRIVLLMLFQVNHAAHFIAASPTLSPCVHRAGVVVLAATSRPDLIDAALLRPGRLDRLLYCALPTTRQREAILAALSTCLALSPRTSLRQLAQRTQGWTGADLGALLADAQLAAAHRLLAQGSGAQQVQPQNCKLCVPLRDDASRSTFIPLKGP